MGGAEGAEQGKVVGGGGGDDFETRTMDAHQVRKFWGAPLRLICRFPRQGREECKAYSFANWTASVPVAVLAP